jgi:hypothetical protein
MVLCFFMPDCNVFLWRERPLFFEICEISRKILNAPRHWQLVQHLTDECGVVAPIGQHQDTFGFMAHRLVQVRTLGDDFDGSWLGAGAARAHGGAQQPECGGACARVVLLLGMYERFSYTSHPGRTPRS